MTYREESPYQKGFEDIRKQIDALIVDVTDEKLRKSGIEIDSEPIAVYRLPTDDLGSRSQEGKDLLELAKNTQRWHHQIKLNGKSLACARSGPAEDDETRGALHRLWVSSLAASIDRALDRVERDERIRAAVGENPLVRLLVVPAYQVNALWLIDERARTSQVLVLDFPRRSGQLESDNPLTSREFLERLRKRPKAIGIKAPK
jgi:hypothetical protein